MADCSIIIPVYNQAALTARCVRALLAERAPFPSREIIVVDDGSSDDIAGALADVRGGLRVLTRGANGGFATACNDGAAIATGEYLVFVNTDIIPTDGWLEALVSFATAHPAAAAVGAKLLYPDETVQHAGVVIAQDRYPRHIYAGFPADHPAVNKSRQFRAVTAACALFRRSPFEQVGGFDTAFFNEFEDVDLCLRLGTHGHEVHYCHESVLYHLESVSREHRSERREANRHLYHQRWGDRLPPDDLAYYVDDGLMTLGDHGSYPLRLDVSPLLATLSGDARERQVEQLLAVRSRQALELLKETIRLSVRIGELELRGAGTAVNPPGANMARLIRAREVLQRRVADMDPSGGDAGQDWATRAIRTVAARGAGAVPDVATGHREILRADEAIQSAILDYQTAIAHAAEGEPTRPGDTIPRFVPGRFLVYQQLIRRIREDAQHHLPTDATVVVVSKGDEALLELCGRTAWHFPQTEAGMYAGHHPADSTAAIAHLEALRGRGAEYFLLPSTSYWWLDYYTEFRDYLCSHYTVVYSGPETCTIYALRTLGAERRFIAAGDVAEPVSSARRTQQLVRSILPTGASLIVTKIGGDTLIDTGGNRIWQFPSGDDTRQSGTDLPDAALTEQFEELRKQGAQFFLIPHTAYAWLDGHPRFAIYLEEKYPTVMRQEHSCTIYALEGP